MGNCFGFHKYSRISPDYDADIEQLEDTVKIINAKFERLEVKYGNVLQHFKEDIETVRKRVDKTETQINKTESRIQNLEERNQKSKRKFKELFMSSSEDSLENPL